MTASSGPMSSSASNCSPSTSVRTQLSWRKSLVRRGWRPRTCAPRPRTTSRGPRARRREAGGQRGEVEQEKGGALKDKEEAYGIIEDGIEQLRAQAREDARLGRRAGIAELRERSLEMREKLSQMIPDDRDNMRDQIQQK